MADDIQGRMGPLDGVVAPRLFHFLPSTLLEELTTMLLQLLFNDKFKHTFTLCLMRHYRDLVLPRDPAVHEKVMQCLDRMMAQVRVRSRSTACSWVVGDAAFLSHG